MHGDTDKSSLLIDCKEGVSQGCPASMIIYGLLLVPLIIKLKRSFPDLFSPWYADDGSAGGKLDLLHHFFDAAQVLGHPYGHYPEMEKCILSINPKNDVSAAALNTLHQHTFKISHGERFLGSFIGAQALTDE